jgi:hypothetical protein
MGADMAPDKIVAIRATWTLEDAQYHVQIDAVMVSPDSVEALREQCDYLAPLRLSDTIEGIQQAIACAIYGKKTYDEWTDAFRENVINFHWHVMPPDVEDR